MKCECNPHTVVGGYPSCYIYTKWPIKEIDEIARARKAKKLPLTLTYIESTRWACAPNIASGLNMYAKIIKESHIFKRLIRCYDAELIGDRIVTLVSADFDRAYANPYETAVCTYLLALPDIEQIAASLIILNHFENGYYTVKLAQAFHLASMYKYKVEEN